MNKFVIFSIIGLYVLEKLTSKPQRKTMGNPRWESQEERKLNCKFCDKEFTAYSKTAKFCSSKCSNKHHQVTSEKAYKEKKCPICGDKFMQNQFGRKATTCSKECGGQVQWIGHKREGQCEVCDRKFPKDWRNRFKKTCSTECMKELKSNIGKEVAKKRNLNQVKKPYPKCKTCGKETGDYRTKFCTKKCFYKHRKENEKR